MEEHLEERLGIVLPKGSEIACVDTHGGFHGDGVLLAVVTLPGQEEMDSLLEGIEGRWKDPPTDGEMMEQFQQIWTQYAGGLGSMPEKDAGPWFYRDRFFEQYGERSSVFQNCTFAILDKDTGQLYVLEVDC